MLKVGLLMLAAAVPLLCQRFEHDGPGTYLYWQGEGDGGTSVSIKGRTVDGVGRFRYRLVAPLAD
ncbi:MAG TPA: hypothetical protein VN893_25980, partial [Bryobacteraceae bacterium]|nr:hypothetical protein [Bryobacteraceae bacterium]